MATTIAFADLAEQRVGEEYDWYELYTWLLPLVEMWVRDSRVTSWQGQQKEVAEDITHEAISRTFRYNQRAQRGEMPPIGSLKALCRVIARNYFRDWRKKDWYLVHPSEDAYVYTISGSRDMVDAAQIALDHLILDSIIVAVAQVVVKFPQGQKMALLTDLANISDSDDAPTVLEQALLDVGLQLSDYKRPPSDDPAERGRYAALRCIAYKRLKDAMQV
jgi:DNA-directed RNA polymerase specialized sigma24 family protein